MNAVKALMLARVAGIQIKIDGDDLALEASALPPADLLDLLAQHKTDIVTLLREGNDGCAGEHWREFLEERAANAEFDGGLSRDQEKLTTPTLGTSESSKGPSAGSAGPLQTQSETSLSAMQEAARLDVLSQLARNAAVQRAFVNRFEHDGTMIVTLAIRGVGTGELKIPAARFSQNSIADYAALLGCIEGSA